MGNECHSLIERATEIIEKMLLSKEGKDNLKSLFRLCQPMESKKDISTFMSALMSNWQGTGN